MKKIALEEHFIVSDFVKHTEADMISFKEDRAKDILLRLRDFNDMRLQAMNDAGIEIAVLSLTDPGVQRERNVQLAIKLAHKANDLLAEQIQKHPKRYRGFAHLALQNPQAAADELERCVRDLHFVGVLINGQTNGHYLDEEQYYPFWERVQELQVPIYLHPGAPYQVPQNYVDHPELEGALWGWTAETATHALRLLFAGIFDRYPKVKVLLGHMGETLPYLLWRLDSRWNLLKHSKELHKNPSQYVRDNIYITTSGVCSNNSLLCALGALGEDHVMFSVDYPYESSESAAEFIDKAPISEVIREKVCYKNAEAILPLNL